MKAVNEASHPLYGWTIYRRLGKPGPWMSLNLRRDAGRAQHREGRYSFYITFDGERFAGNDDAYYIRDRWPDLLAAVAELVSQEGC